jgi:hypothetical protein
MIRVPCRVLLLPLPPAVAVIFDEWKMEDTARNSHHEKVEEDRPEVKSRKISDDSLPPLSYDDSPVPKETTESTGT